MINLTLKRAVAVAILAGASVGANAAQQDAGTVKLDVPTSFNGFVLGRCISTSLNDIYHSSLRKQPLAVQDSVSSIFP